MLLASSFGFLGPSPAAARTGSAPPPPPAARCIEDPGGLAADGLVDRAGLRRVEDRLIELGPGACAEELISLVEQHTFYVISSLALDVLARWDSPVALPPLYQAYGRAMLRPHSRDEDVAFTTATAISELTDGAVLAGVRDRAVVDGWIDLARVRYLEEWGPDLEAEGVTAPPTDDAWRVDTRARFSECLGPPPSAPPDPFDPLGLLVGPSARLSVGTRCASSAVVQSWTSSTPPWAAVVRDLLRRYTEPGPLLSLAGALERGWGQGRSLRDGAPSRDVWRSPDVGSSGRAGKWALVVLLGGALGAALYVERWRGRVLGLLLGSLILIGVEWGLSLAGGLPGDELRDLGESPLRGSAAAGDSVVRDLRRRPFPIPPPEGRARVAFVGASTVAGPALSVDQSIPERLRRALAEDVPCLEVPNLGQHGFASPAIRALSIRAVDDLGAHAVVVYMGHNEVADMRERSRYVDTRPRSLRWLAPMERTHLYGAMKSLLGGPRDQPSTPAQVAQEALDMELHLPRFEAAVTARFERELTDLARALERRSVPLVLVAPAFNHHGLRVRPLPADGDVAALEERVRASLRGGAGSEAVAHAEALVAAAPRHPAPRFLLSLANELAGSADGAESATWETLRRNQVGSAVTPGVAAAIARIAVDYGLPLADAHAATHDAAFPHQPGFDIFMDYVHVNPEGARIVADEVARTMRAAGVTTALARRSPRGNLLRGDGGTMRLIGAFLLVLASALTAADAHAVVVGYEGLSGSTGFSYTESGVRHRFYTTDYTTTGHWHRGGSSGDYFIYGHSSCCSQRAIIDMNGSVFIMQDLLIEHENTLAEWTGYLNGAVVWTVTQTGATGSTFTFPTGTVDEVRYLLPGGGNLGWDDLQVQLCLPVADAGGPYTVPEGGTGPVTAAASTATGSTITSYDWDLTSGTGAGPFTDATGVTATFSAGTLDGPTSTTIGVQTTCLGVLDDDDAAVSITNVAPTVTETIPGAADENDTVAFAVTATDPGPDSFTYLWDFGDGLASTAQNPTHVYPDDGSFVVTVTVDDGDDTTVATGTVVVGNLPPTVTSSLGPATGDEGDLLTFAGSASDPSPVDAVALAYTWDWGDTTTGSGAAAQHAWADDGTYTIVFTVTDPQGATASATLTTTIANVAPVIDTSPTLTATESVPWSYAPSATDPGADTLTWAVTGPAAMTVDPATGLLEWTPTLADAGPHAVTLTVDDGDGGTDTQSFTLVVAFVDDDGDGMSDTWETANGLDPTDPADAAGDPDADGLTNLDEFLEGTDPNVYDGPDIPVPTAPIDGAEVADAEPTLAWDPANDPNGDPLTYDVEVYADTGLANLLTSGSTAALDWDVDTPLAENADAYWRVRADDGWITSPWSDLEPFFVNETNEAPSLPVALDPVDEQTVASTSPELTWSDSTDPDRDPVGYDVRVTRPDGEIVAGAVLPPPAARETSWTVDIVLDEDAWYVWQVEALDDEGLGSGYTEGESFFVSTDDAPPSEVVFLDPLDQDVVESASPALEASESVDPEGTDVTYRFGLDTVESFDSGDFIEAELPHAGTGSVVWDLAADGVVLAEDTTWHARVRAEDEAGLASGWDLIEFFVRGDNDPPDVPPLISPEDGAAASGDPVLAVGHVTDPEGDDVLYDIRVGVDLGFSEVIVETSGLAAGEGPEGTADQTSWQAAVGVVGTVYWSARAVDDRGAASDWAVARSLTFDDGELPPGDDDDDDDVDGPDCGCTEAPGAAPGWWLLAVVPLVVRRRR